MHVVDDFWVHANVKIKHTPSFFSVRCNVMPDIAPSRSITFVPDVNVSFNLYGHFYDIIFNDLS